MTRTDPNESTVLVCTAIGLATVLAGLIYVTGRDDAPPVTAVNAQAGLMTAGASTQIRGTVAMGESAAASQIAETFIAGNEESAIATLRAIVDAQGQVRAAASIDADGDGDGEFAYLGELMGLASRTLPLLDGEEVAPELRVDPALLDPSFGILTRSARGTVLLRDGYAFQVHLPGPTASDEEFDLYPGLAESGVDGVGGTTPDDVQPDVIASAHAWVCYAWPLEHGRSGVRAFFVDQDGIVVQTPNGSGLYAGLDRVPRYDAALCSAGRGNLLAAAGWTDGTSVDGQRWEALTD